jgi:hypothetical protein
MLSSREETSEHTEKILEPETIIQLLDVYLTEFIHRSTVLWAQTYRHFYAILIVMILPNITSYLNIHLPPIMPKLFPILGIIMTGFFWYMSFGYAKRLEAIGDTYQKLIDTLPQQYQRISITTINGRLFKIRLSKLISIVLSSVLIIIGFVLLFTKSASADKSLVEIHGEIKIHP